MAAPELEPKWTARRWRYDGAGNIAALPGQLPIIFLASRLNDGAGSADEVGYMVAASPDLYAALLPLAVSDPDNPPPGVSVEDWRGAVMAARAARAKARGET